MRTARIRYDQELCYYHLLNRVAGKPEYLPFGDVEKEHFFGLIEKLTQLYTIEILAVVVMSNHYHIVCAAPATPPPRSEIERRWRAYYGNKIQVEPNWDDPEVVAAWGTRLRNISCFIKDLQQRFTCWYNRMEGRRGTLWADRFKNVILESGKAVWECIRYVEMNPVRAGICETPEEYRFSSWGRASGIGRHPFVENLIRHMRPMLINLFGEAARGLSDTEVLAELRADMARLAASERGEHPEAVAAAAKNARKGTGFYITARRRVRYWSDGVIIGSKTFVRGVMARFADPERVGKKRLTPARDDTTEETAGLYCWRRLMTPFD